MMKCLCKIYPRKCFFTFLLLLIVFKMLSSNLGFWLIKEKVENAGIFFPFISSLFLLPHEWGIGWLPLYSLWGLFNKTKITDFGIASGGCAFNNIWTLFSKFNSQIRDSHVIVHLWFISSLIAMRVSEAKTWLLLPICPHRAASCCPNRKDISIKMP